MSKLHTTGSFRGTDFIMGSVLASVLLVSTACGAAPVPTGAPTSSIQSSAATTAASPTPEATPTEASSAPAEDSAPLDAEQVPDAGGADLASNVQPAFASTALDILATLPIKGRAPKTGYARTEFGQAWADVDRNGCDTRNDILSRDLTAKTFKAGTRDCLVLTGVLADPYTATSISFTRGSTTSSAVQIDHVVALSDAWQKGAQQLTVEQRTALANDPLNLLAVDGPTNQQKSDGDAATWLPPNKAYRCDYVARQISVKATYSLWVTAAEHDAMARILGTCSDMLVPTDQIAPVVEAVVVPTVKPAAPVEVAPVEAAPAEVAPVEAPAPVPLVAPAAEPYYQNCTAVRAAGAAPIKVGDPGFQDKFDGDGDGVGCE